MSTSSTTPTRFPLYERLPEIYRVRDAEQQPPGQLAAYLRLVEEVFGAVHDNIGALYDDLFIETCDSWVIPYIGDLLGISPLAGDPWTLRADVADTIRLRRGKGTLHAIELLAFDLTEWAAHCVELRDMLAWHQHLNHQRPDVQTTVQGIVGAARGGTVNLRSPALLSLLGTPFDPFAYYPDLKPVQVGTLRPNLPAVAIFLWRLAVYQAQVSMPVQRGVTVLTPSAAADAARAVRFDMEPTGKPIVLFNTQRSSPNTNPPVLSKVDEVPGPIPMVRLTQMSPLGVPQEYVTVNTYDSSVASLDALEISPLGLQFHLPAGTFPTDTWVIRGANLCAWEVGLVPVLGNREIVIDPRIGRVVFGVETDAEANALQSTLLATFTYGLSGDIGAHPVPTSLPAFWADPAIVPIVVQYRQDTLGLQHALNNLDAATGPVLIEIDDSMTHILDLTSIAGATVENGVTSLRLKFPLAIVATSGNRPVVQLRSPLAFRPAVVVDGSSTSQQSLATLNVYLEGIYFCGDGLAAGTALIERAAVARLEVVRCTLDPGGVLGLNNQRTATRAAFSLDAKFGFASNAEYASFNVTPQIVVSHSITGPLWMESVYALHLHNAIVDAGAGPNEDGTLAFAIAAAANSATGYGPTLAFQKITVFGRVRARSACGAGGIFCHALEAQNNQVGCIQYSSFSSEKNQLPQNYACVTGVVADFTAVCWNQAGYAQLTLDSDPLVREGGPGDDQMGAFAFLLEAHKWRNLQIRLREYMPAGIRPEIVTVT